MNSVFIFVRHLSLSLGYIAQDTGPHIPAITLTQPCRARAETRSRFSNRAGLSGHSGKQSRSRAAFLHKRKQAARFGEEVGQGPVSIFEQLLQWASKPAGAK